MESILVPVNLVSLGAAIAARVGALTPDSPSDDVLAIIKLVDTLESTLDRLALEFEPDDAINTVADVAAV
jgi:hypothetical protein